MCLPGHVALCVVVNLGICMVICMVHLALIFAFACSSLILWWALVLAIWCVFVHVVLRLFCQKVFACVGQCGGTWLRLSVVLSVVFPWQTISVKKHNGLSTNWPRGPMDKASAYGAGDCRFEACRGQLLWESFQTSAYTEQRFVNRF